MTSIDDRINKLEELLKQEKAKKALLNARLRSEQQKKDRAADTRRKVLVGAVILNQVDAGRFPREELRQMLDQALSKDADRVLFGLPTRANEESTLPPLEWRKI